MLCAPSAVTAANVLQVGFYWIWITPAVPALSFQTGLWCLRGSFRNISNEILHKFGHFLEKGGGLFFDCDHNISLIILKQDQKYDIVNN